RPMLFGPCTSIEDALANSLNSASSSGGNPVDGTSAVAHPIASSSRSTPTTVGAGSDTTAVSSPWGRSPMAETVGRPSMEFPVGWTRWMSPANRSSRRLNSTSFPAAVLRAEAPMIATEAGRRSRVNCEVRNVMGNLSSSCGAASCVRSVRLVILLRTHYVEVKPDSIREVAKMRQPLPRWKRIGRGAVQMLLLMLGCTLLVFLLQSLSGRDPGRAILGQYASQDA